MNNQNRQAIERRIVDKAVNSLLDAGYAVSVFDGEETTLSGSVDAKAITAAMYTTDADRLHVSRQVDGQEVKGWVLFVYGNGVDVIADHTVNIEEELKPAAELADALDNA